MHEDFAKQVLENQQNLGSELRKSFDYIVCGAGTTGCVVAARLAADSTWDFYASEAGDASKVGGELARTLPSLVSLSALSCVTLGMVKNGPRRRHRRERKPR